MFPLRLKKGEANEGERRVRELLGKGIKTNKDDSSKFLTTDNDFQC